MLIAVISLSLTVGNLRYPYQGSQPPVQGRVMIAASLLMPLFLYPKSEMVDASFSSELNIFLFHFLVISFLFRIFAAIFYM